MRELNRPDVKLPTLTRGVGATKAAEHLRVRTEDRSAALSFPAYWNAPDVRGALYAMHGRVCAFCLCELTRGNRGDVEHFRPKSLYFWLAYTFSNYLLSCSQCNRIWKHEHFPIEPGQPRLGYDGRDVLATEARLFLDPCADPVEDMLRLTEVDGLLVWRAAPTLAPRSLPHARVVETSDWFHWNDDPDLHRARTDAIDHALVELEKGNQDEARRCASRYRPHGGAVRSLLGSLGAIQPPTIDEEVAWLLEDLWDEWQWAKRIGGDLSRKRFEELEWTFAVLWKAPPPGTTLDIGAWLADAGLWGDVEAKYRQM